MRNYRITGTLQVAGEPSRSEQNGQDVQLKTLRLSELVRILEDDWDRLYDYNSEIVPQLHQLKQDYLAMLCKRNLCLFYLGVSWFIFAIYVIGGLFYGINP